jgi:hypothetical protein
MVISAITLADPSAGSHEVRRNDEHYAYDEHTKQARRLDVLQRAESEFDRIRSPSTPKRPGFVGEGRRLRSR